MSKAITTEKSDTALRNERQRIQTPINLKAWDHLNGKLKDSDRELLLWFHQHVLDREMTWKEVTRAVDYDRTTLFRCLTGTYQAESWAKPLAKIRAYRKGVEKHSRAVEKKFAMNRQAQRVFGALDFALTQSTMVSLEGEARMGKTEAAKQWVEQRGPGRAVMIECPVIGSPIAVLKEIARKVGLSHKEKRQNMARRIGNAFSSDRVLVIDEAGRMFPKGKGSPEALDEIRSIHDRTGCGIALLVTRADVKKLTESAYMVGQLIGRIDLPAMLPEFEQNDVDVIVNQFGKFSKPIRQKLYRVATQPGRLGAMLSILKTANRFALKNREEITDKHVEAAIAARFAATGGDENLLAQYQRAL